MKEIIEKLRKEGKSRKEIIKILGCSSATVSKYIPGKINELGKKIIELRNQGLSEREIVLKLKCAKSTVSKWCSTLPDFEQVKKHKISKYKQKLKADKQILKSNKQQKQIVQIDNYRVWKKEIRNKRKNFILDLANNKCAICGYNKCKQALSFHNLNPIDKEFNINGIRLECNFEKVLKEVEKCILLCNNCHAEVHFNSLNISNMKPIKINKPIPDELLNYHKLDLTPELLLREYHWIKCKINKKREIIDRKCSNFNLSDIVIKDIDRFVMNNVLEKYHYLGLSNKAQISKLGFFIDFNLLGVCLVTNPIRKTFDKTCEISRFCLCFDQHNLASKCLSLVIKYIKSLNKYKFIQAFSQNDVHIGTIYKAANFVMSGSSKDSYNYDGIHKKTIYERSFSLGLSEQEYSIQFGLNKIIESGKTKWLYKL